MKHKLLFALLLIGSLAYAVCDSAGAGATDITATLSGGTGITLSSANTCNYITASVTGLNSAINITATNITLDCGGFTITGTNATGTYGVRVASTFDNISNCIISGFDTGIYLNGATNATINNNTVNVSRNGASPGGQGINLITASSNNITNNNFSSVYGSGIMLRVSSHKNIFTNNIAYGGGSGHAGLFILSAGGSCSYNNFTNITASGTSNGIYLSLSVSNNISDSRATGVGAGVGILFDQGAATNIIRNTTITSTTGNGVSIVGGSTNNNALINTTITATTGKGALIYNVVTGNNITNSQITGTPALELGNAGGTTPSNVVGSTIANNNLTGVSTYTVVVVGLGNSTIRNNTINGKQTGILWAIASNVTVEGNWVNASGSSDDAPLWINSYGTGFICDNSTFANNTFTTSHATTQAIRFRGLTTQACNNNLFINNTLINPLAGGLLFLGGNNRSGNNTFYWNNFTATSGYSVTDHNGTNYYNSSTEGNIWPDVVNGTTNISGLTPSTGYPQYFIGNNGTSLPYNNSTALTGRLYGNVVDNFPLTPYDFQCGFLGTANTVYTLKGNINITGATCLNITNDNITLNCQGFVISGSNATSTSGIFTNQNNTKMLQCNVTNFFYGIYTTTRQQNLTIADSYVMTTHTTGRGVYLALGDYLNFTNNTLHAYLYTFTPDGQRYASILNNRFFSKADRAFYMLASAGTPSQNHISGNLIAANKTSGNFEAAYLTGSTSNFTGNLVNGSGGLLLAAGYSNINITNNTINTTLLTAAQYTSFVAASGAGTGNNFSNNTIEHFSGGYQSLISQMNDLYIGYNNIIHRATTTAIQFGTGGVRQVFKNNTVSCLYPTYGAITIGSGATDMNFTGNNIVNCSQITSTVSGSAHRASIANNTFRYAWTTGVYNGFVINTGNNFWNVTNNTFIAVTGNQNFTFVNGTNATFWWNNFTNTSGFYVNDSNLTSRYNTSIGGVAQGNYWFNVLNGSVEILDSNADGWGDSGSGYPYSNNTSQGKLWGSNVIDYAPAVLAGATVLYPINVYYNGNVSLYFANGSVANITTFSAFSGTPGITIIDPSGATQFNGSMGASAAGYYYEYTLNASVGWYNVTISDGTSSFSRSHLFYMGGSWQGDFTDSDGNAYPFRHQFNLTEPGTATRRWQPMEILINTSQGANESAIRMALSQGGSLIEIPSQLYGFNYSGPSNRSASAYLVFVDSFAKSQTKTYYYAYSYSALSSPSYTSDLSTANGTTASIQNMHYQVNVSSTYGGAATGLKSRYSDTEFSANGTPMLSPRVELFSGVLSYSAKDSSPTLANLANGSVFARYTSTGSVTFFNYSMTYTFYQNTPFFILETNVTPLISPVTWDAYQDAYLLISKAKFGNLTYENSTGLGNYSQVNSGAGVDVQNLTALHYVFFSSALNNNGFGIAFANNTSSRAFASRGFENDTSAFQILSNRLYNGSVASTDSFYTKKAYLFFDPANVTLINDTYLALNSPMALSFGGLESFTVAPPNYSSTGYSPSSPNDTDNITCFSYWQSVINLLNYSLIFNSSNYTFTGSGSLSTPATWVNFTANSTDLQFGAAYCNITVYDGLGQSNSTQINFSIGDKKAPLFALINTSPSTAAALDPGVIITVGANLTEFSNISTAILQYTTDGTAYTNVTMLSIQNGTNWFFYQANFTPSTEANYTYQVFANDTASNQNTSSNATLDVSYDWTWTISPGSLATVSGSLLTNVSLANLTINATGDKNITIKITSNFFDLAKIFYNGTAEGVSGYTFTAAPNATVYINVTATTRSSQVVDSVNLTFTAQNASAAPQSNSTAGTLLSLAGGPFLFMDFTSIPAAVSQGNSSVPITGRVTNYGNETATTVIFTWTIPSDWSLVTGSLTESTASIAAGGSFSSSVTLSVPSSATVGNRDVTISTTSLEGVNGTATDSIQVVETGGGGGGGGTGGGSGGGGGGGGGGGAGQITTTPVAIKPKPVEQQLTTEQKSQLFNTLETYELVRGKDSAFNLTITNPLASDLDNVTIAVSGYLYQYLRLEPEFIDRIPAGQSRTVKIFIEAPTYFTEGTFTLYFDISGTAVTQTESAITTTTIQEKRTVELKILEMTRPEADKLMSEIFSIRNQLIGEGLYNGEVIALFDSAQASYSDDKFGAVKSALDKMRDLKASALSAKERLAALRDKLSRAESEDFSVEQTNRLYALALSAFERGDYANSMLRLGEAELTYALETRETFSLTAFMKKYAMQIVLGAIILAVVSGIVFLDVRFWMMDNELSQLGSEEAILLGLLKEVQTDYFEKGKMSTSEYSSSVEQYEARLSKMVERKVELETLKKNYFNFKGRGARLLAEKARLEELIRGLQKDYLETGKVETHIYENRMKSYVTRLSEVEESIAVHEAQETIKKQSSITDIFKKQPPSSA